MGFTAIFTTTSKWAHPGVFLAQLNHKSSVNTTQFHRNHTTCFGPLDPSSSAYRFEICRHLVIITFLSQYLWDSVLHNKSYYNHFHQVTTQLQFVPCWFSYRHFPSSGTSELEFISGGVFIWFQRGTGLGFETVFPAKLVFPPPPLPNFHSVSQTVTPLLLGSSQRNLAVPFNSTKGLDQRSLIIYSNGQ